MNKKNVKNTQPVILTIDDEETIRLLFRINLEANNYRVLEAENGRVGISVFEKERPDLVLVDLSMPIVSGLEVLAHLKKISPDTPVIVVSATESIGDAINALHLGAWDFVLKPIPLISRFLHLIGKTLEQAQLKIQNKKYQQDLEKAYNQIKMDLDSGRNIQKKLLPPENLQIGEYFFKHYLYPSLYLSGDYVDYFEINEKYVAFFIADVSGHGVPSALVTVLLKSFRRKQLDAFLNNEQSFIIEPAKLFEVLNVELFRENLDKYLTIFYGLINKKDNTLTYSNGGQYPFPILINKKNNKCEFLKTNGSPVGLIPNMSYETIQIKLPVDFLLVLFSDGILELLPQDNLEQKFNFLVKLSKEKKAGIKKLVQMLNSEKMEFPDDVTILTVERGSLE